MAADRDTSRWLNSVHVIRDCTGRPLEISHTHNLRFRKQSQEDLVSKVRVLLDDVAPSRRDDTVVDDGLHVRHCAFDESPLDLRVGVLVEDQEGPPPEVDKAAPDDEVVEAAPELLERPGAERLDLEVVGHDGRGYGVDLLLLVELVSVQELEHHVDGLLRQVAIAEVKGLGLGLLGVSSWSC